MGNGYGSASWQSRQRNNNKKDTMNNQQVAHLWASGNKENGKGSNFYFEGGTIYSYGNHFPIARRVGENLYLVTDRGYSMTTAKHKSLVYRAIPSFAKVFLVENPKHSLQGIVDQSVDRAFKEEKREPHKQAFYRYEKAKGLADYCENRRDLISHLTKIDPSLEVSSALNSFYAIEGRAFGVMNENAKAWQDATDKKQAQREAREVKRQARIEENNRILRLSAEEKAQEWRDGWQGSGYYSLRILPPMLRINGDKVETSHGAVVDLEDARKAFAFIGKKIEEGKEWHRNGETCPVGPFSLVSIDSEAVVVGCHRFTIEEVKAFGNLLNK